jgi:ABC-2 type transport system ATP-binding protein
MDRQSKQLLIDFINHTMKQHGYEFRILSALDLTDDALESAFKQLKELQVEQMKPEVEVNPPFTSTSVHNEMIMVEAPNNSKETVKDNVIQFQEVNCRISGKDILRRITLNVKRGEIMGILGKNGAGKTTFLSLISGLRSPTSGKITVLGERVPAGAKFRKKMGFVLQENALCEELTVFENLQFSASLYDMQNSQKRILEVLEILGLSDRSDQVVSTLSGGLKRRTAIARAFLHDPELFIIDEPTLGVDVDTRHALWAYLRLLRSRDKTVIVATNYLDEALALCDRVAVLGEGVVLTIAEPHELVRSTGSCLDVECDEQTAQRIASGVVNPPQVIRCDITSSGISLFLAKGVSPDEVSRELSKHGRIEGFCFRAPDLSEVFKSLGRS